MRISDFFSERLLKLDAGLMLSDQESIDELVKSLYSYKEKFSFGLQVQAGVDLAEIKELLLNLGVKIIISVQFTC